MQALSSIHSFFAEFPSQAQLQALKLSVRLETSIAPSDFLSDILEGERWLESAAGNVSPRYPLLSLNGIDHVTNIKAEEAPSALWYFFAATRLQKWYCERFWFF